MYDWRRIGTVGAIVLTAGVCLGAVSAPATEEIERNRQRLDKIRSDPERARQFYHNWKTFNQLSKEQREKMRQLDRALREEPSATQVRLLRTAQRYANWLNQLPEEDRRKIAAATDKEKLELIKEIRRRQWIEQLPKAYRERIQRAQGQERQDLIEHYRAEERARREKWQMALRHWATGLPDRPEKMPKEVRKFLSDELMPRLSREEKDRLRDAEGRWPDYPRALVKLLDDEKVIFRLLIPLEGPSSFEELPEEFRKQLQSRPLILEASKKRLASYSGKWPHFAIAVAEGAEKLNIPTHLLGHCRPKDFPQPLCDFINEKLMAETVSVLSKEEKERLRKAEGHWPLYPRTLAELVHNHRLHLPLASLPGPAEYWNEYRREKIPAPSDKTSMVSDQILYEFAMSELKPEERAELDVSLTDPLGRERLQQEYIKRHPEEWQKLVESDQQKRLRRK